MPDEPFHRSATVDAGAVYEGIRQRFVSVVASLTPDQVVGRVPATPDWSVGDVLAHVVGITADLNRQHFPHSDDIGGSQWAGEQVDSRRSCGMATIVREWDREAAGFEDGLRAFGYEVGSHFVADLFAHYSDVRHAIGLTPDPDRVAVEVSLDHYLGFVDDLMKRSTWGVCELTAGGTTWHLGSPGLHHATVHAQPFELLRAVSARRSLRQVRALDWTGQADELLDLMQRGFTGGYSFPNADMIE
jgi:uncharacterized protein (TIGR03083 family)